MVSYKLGKYWIFQLSRGNRCTDLGLRILNHLKIVIVVFEAVDPD